MIPSSPTGAPQSLRLGSFIKDHQQEIMEAWEAALRKDEAEPLPRPLLWDHVPVLLHRMAEVVDSVSADKPEVLGDMPELYALHRLDTGMDLRTVVSELAALRQAILRRWEPHTIQANGFTVLHEVLRFNDTLDLAISKSIEKYVSARLRTLQALDRIAACALGKRQLEAFLPELLQVVLDTTESADCASLFLREGDRLILRANVGKEPANCQELSMRIGEGFVGQIAAAKQPRSLSDVATERRGDQEEAQGLLVARYGVPMLHEGELLGVALLGSTTAPDFSEADQQLFRTMAQRATSIVVQSELMQRQLDEEKRRAEFERQLVGIVSHDLRNPLGVIAITAASLLERIGAFDANTARQITLIRTSAERAARLVGELLDFTRARLGSGIPIHKRPTNLHALARQAADEVMALFPGRQLEVQASGPDQAFFDAERMAQVFSNLLSNAFKYSPSGSIVQLGTANDGEQIHIRVHNEGEPIPPEFLPHIFEPMRTTADGQMSLGLGLFIVSEVVRAHRGTIAVESTAGVGTTFTLKLPAK